MAEKTGRRRVDIPLDVYNGVEKSARYLHIPVKTYVTLILADAVKADQKGLRRFWNQ